MKGMVFTEFLEMVDERFGSDMVDQIIDAAALPSGGAYTSVGTYDHREMIELVTHLSAATAIDAPDLIRAFGRYLFPRFALGYPHLFAGINSTFAFLEKIDDYIHVETRKLYADAELPVFDYSYRNAHHMELNYRSTRPFADLAEGLIMGCIEHFGEDVLVESEDLSGGQRTMVRFSLQRGSQHER